MRRVEFRLDTLHHKARRGWLLDEPKFEIATGWASRDYSRAIKVDNETFSAVKVACLSPYVFLLSKGGERLSLLDRRAPGQPRIYYTDEVLEKNVILVCEKSLRDVEPFEALMDYLEENDDD